MRFAKCFFVGVVLVSLSIVNLPAQVLFTDGFEGYNLGALDKNFAAGPNTAPNGSGNPWFGPGAQYGVPNMAVVGTEGAVTPHSGSQMVRGASGQNQYISQEWYNAAYRLNAQPYSYYVELDWWFYDPLGGGGTTYMDYMALTYYSLAPNNTDYPVPVNDLNTSTTRERLGLGAASDTSVGYDSSKYQARVLGAAGSYSGGWFNTSVTRSVGWHHGQIIFGAAKGDGTADVEFRIDGNVAFSHSSVQAVGVNSIEMNSNYGETDGYFDDVRLGVVPEPSATVLFLCGAAMLLRLRRQRQ